MSTVRRYNTAELAPPASARAPIRWWLVGTGIGVVLLASALVGKAAFIATLTIAKLTALVVAYRKVKQKRRYREE